MRTRQKRLLFLMLLMVPVVALALPLLDASAAAEPGLTEQLYFWFKSHMDYPTLVLLMAMESSIIPLPSEVVVPPAAYFALQTNTDLNIAMVIVMATVGAYLGSAINYWLSVWLGRPIIYAFADSKVGHLLRLSKEKLEHAESFFQRKGSVSIFIGRLLPVVRHLISIPAGLSRMNFGTFTLYTVLGAGLWNVVLAALGYMLYLVVPDDSLLFDQLEHYSLYLKIAGFALLALVAVYLVYKYRKNHSKQPDKTPEP